MKPPIVKTYFEQTFKGLILVLCIILTCFSCKKDDEDAYETILIDITGEPDKVIENVTGTLYYDKAFKMWEVYDHFLDTIYAGVYLIVEMPDSNFSFNEGKEVTVSGLCYEIPLDIYLDFRSKRNSGKGYIQYSLLAAPTKHFYIKVTDLKYKD